MSGLLQAWYQVKCFLNIFMYGSQDPGKWVGPSVSRRRLMRREVEELVRSCTAHGAGEPGLRILGVLSHFIVQQLWFCGCGN